MGTVVVKMLNGQSRSHRNCGYSVYKGTLFIWSNGGNRANKKPVATYKLSELHSKKKTTRKGWYVTK